MPINTCLSPLGSICSLKTYCSFPFVKEKQRVILIFQVSQFKVCGSLVVGLWSSVCASFARLPARSSSTQRLVPDMCNYFLVLGVWSWVRAWMLSFVQTTTCKKRSGNRSGKKARTTNHQAQNCGKIAFFSFGNQKKNIKK